MVQIGILSDTHGFLHPRVFDFFKGCNEIWHAGDIGSSMVTDRLSAFKPLRAVHGNIDDQIVRSQFKESEVFEVEGMKVLLTHIAGYPGKFNKNAQQLILAHQPTILVAGHSHILKVQYDKRYQLLFINPGAAGLHGFHERITFVRLCISGSSVHDLEVLDLERRSLSDAIDGAQ